MPSSLGIAGSSVVTVTWGDRRVAYVATQLARLGQLKVKNQLVTALAPHPQRGGIGQADMQATAPVEISASCARDE
jgi:hypothetical protein